MYVSPAFRSLGKCSEYLKGTLTGAYVVDVWLPKGHETCQQCRFIASDRFDKCVCIISGEILNNHKRSRGVDCPVKWEEEK